jgi:protoporphyrinogen oxidase
LSVVDKVELITSFCNRPSVQAGDTYDDWLRHQYGDAISERYPIKYTNKYWATPAHDLSTTWIGNRMRRAAVEEILYGAMSEETPNTYYTKEMRYPKSGGYKAFITPLIKASEVRLNHRVISVDPTKRSVSFANGMIVQYEKLVSTLPLPLFVPMIIGVPQSVTCAAASLKATSIDLISVAFKRSLVKDLWFYIYDSDILASRAYSPSVKSVDNAPLGTSSLQFEIYSRGEISSFHPEELKTNTLYALKKMGIADESDVKFIDHRFLPYGNVIFDLGMEENRRIVRNWIGSLNIATCGRFGEWDYLWSNQSFLSGYAAI